MYYNSPPQGAMPRLLGELAGKWYHQFARLVLTIEVYVTLLIFVAIAN